MRVKVLCLPFSSALWYLSQSYRQYRCLVQDYGLQLNFRSCGVPPGCILRLSGFATLPISFPGHPSHAALMSEVVLACASILICSKIWDSYFDVNTILDDHVRLPCSPTVLLGQFFCCPWCVLTCMRPDVWSGCFLNRQSHCWKVCSSNFLG